MVLVCQAIGMEWFSFYSTRRAFASWHAAAGTDYVVIQELMGHAISGDVTRLYIDPTVLAEKKREAVERLPRIAP